MVSKFGPKHYCKSKWITGGIVCRRYIYYIYIYIYIYIFMFTSKSKPKHHINNYAHESRPPRTSLDHL